MQDVTGTNVVAGNIAVSEGFTAYSDGMRFGFLPSFSNTGAATLNVSGTGAKAIRNPDGDVLSSGAMVAGRFTEVEFMADDDHFRLVTSGGTTNVTVEGGLILQRAAPSRLVSAAGPSSGVTSVETGWLEKCRRIRCPAYWTPSSQHAASTKTTLIRWGSAGR